MKLKEWIIRKITIRRLFKAYGKRLYQERINYVKENSYEGFKPMPKNLHRMSFRRTVTIILVLVIVMASAIASAVMTEMEIPVISIIDSHDHSDVTVDLSKEEGEFLDIGYIPDGYELVNEDSFEDLAITNVYKDKNDKYLYITQNRSDTVNLNIDNENSHRYVDDINGVEVQIYTYDSGEQIYLFVKDNVCIMVQADLPTEEMQLIVKNIN